jgi:hypothetical protein
LRPLFKDDLEIEVLGLHLTVRRIVGIAVLLCMLGLVLFMVSELGGDDEVPPVNNTTGRYEEDDPNWALCAVFIFLAVVLIAFLIIEVRT